MKDHVHKRGRAELSMTLHVKEHDFNEGRSSDRYPRISSTSSGGRRFHPLAHSVVVGARQGLRCDAVGRSFFQSRDVNPIIATAVQRKTRPLAQLGGLQSTV